MGILVLTAGWSACDRISSALETGPALTPEELPMRGETMLPDIGRPQPDIRITPRGDNRGKSGIAQAADSQPGLDIDRAALRAYIEAMADIFQEPYLSLFIVADSTGEFYSYGYRIIDFHPIEQELSGGERELYIYVHPNETGDGLYRMNVGIIPRSRSAFEDYQRWLLPEYVGLERVDPMQLSLEKNKPGAAFIPEVTNARVSCFWESCVQYVIPIPFSGEPAGTIRGLCWRCILSIFGGGGSTPTSGPGPGTDGGNSCWETDTCRPDPGGGGRDGLDRSGCNGDPGAFWDPVCPNRCVGGDTGWLAAKPGDDCNNLNIPCAGDVVKNPEITSSGASGRTGGRFRPCVGASCPEELRAVRKREDGTYRPHHGTDISCTEGDPIYAPFDMDGLEIGFVAGYGNFVRGWTTIDGVRYNFGAAHLQAAGRASGLVKAGDIIGYCGRSGINPERTEITTHVHLEMGTARTIVGVDRIHGSHLYYRERLVNPELFLSTKFSPDRSASPINRNPCGQ